MAFVMNKLVKIGLVLLLILGSAPLIYAQTTRTDKATTRSSFNPTNPAEPDVEIEEVVVYYKVKISANPSTVAYVSSGGEFTSGSRKHISTSSKNSKYVFSHWTLNGEYYSEESSFDYTIEDFDADFVAHYKFVPSSPVEPNPLPEIKVSPLYLVTNIEGACSFNQSSGNEYEENVRVDVEAFVAKGYEFKGWYNGTTLISSSTRLNYQMPGEPTTLIAYVEKKVYNPGNPSEPEGSQDNVAVGSYNLIYMVDGEEYGTMLVKFGTPITPFSPLHKEGYTFSGWSEIPETMPDYDVVVTGSFSVNSYTITYIVDGEEYKSVVYNYGENVLVEDSPVKEGHTFSGWSEFPATMPAKDITINGSFTVNNYTITYMVDGELYKTEKYAYGSAIAIAESPVKEGYTFSGWSEVPETMPAKDVTVSGSFSVNNYTITYIVDGEVYKIESIAYGSKVEAIASPIKEGHIFSGWSGVPSTMPAKDVTVNGSFTVNSYTITYVVDGEVYKTESIAYGSKVEAIAALVKEGYTFSGWSEVPETMPAKDVMVNGSFTVNNYTITYIVDGEVYKTESIAYGSKVEAIASPVKEGYTFSGWSGVPSTMPAKDITVSGSFAVNTYTVTYMADGEVYKTESIAYGNKVEAIASPVKEGYTFSGWSGVPETMPAKDVTVSGNFTVNNYTITYVVDGELYKTESIAYGSKVEAIASPVKEGYTFSGWSGVPSTMPAKDITVSGSFAVNTYTVTYMVDGEVYKTESIAYGSKVEAIASPVKEGYTFSGWSGVPSTMPAKDIMVSGSFTINSYTITYVVDGEAYKTDSYTYGSAITAAEAPVKEGYTFSGWSGVPSTMPAKDVTVNGSFTVNSYTITYVVDGEVYKTESYAYGSVIAIENSPVKEGYTFSGWSGVPSTMPAKDVTVSGSFTVNSYTITYVVDGEVYKTESIAYGSKVETIAVPIKEGHTFSGWSGVPSMMPAKDVTVNGSFTVNTYTITYMVDGEVYKTESYTYGSAITAMETPVKEGYTFGGWNEVPETMPAKNIMITGSFAVNSYTVTFILEGVVFAEYTLPYGSAIEIPEAPEKEGLSFSGWGKVLETMPAQDLVYEGSYMNNPYTIIYMVDGEEYYRAIVEYGSAITLIAMPVKEGHAFSGWSEVPETMPAKDITVTGSFTVNNYTITYVVDGEVYKTEGIAYGSKVEAIVAPVKEGYTFSGWSGVPNTMPAKDVTVSGSFTVNSYTITYVVDGETYKTENYTYGSAITAAEAPSKEGYTFSGWSEVPETMPAKDVTVSGSFTVNSFTITYIVDGEVYKTESIAYGSKVEAIAAPVKEGYTFSGWSGVPSTMPAKDVTVNGSFTVNTYIITYMVDGELYKTESIAYGSAITAAEAPSREGYTFSGWSEVPETMPAKDVTVSASFTINNYTITYVVDGEVYKTESIAYGSEVAAITAPVKEGYTFSGWSGVPSTMPAKDVTVSGSFTVNSYTITYIVDGEVYKTESIAYGSKVEAIAAPVKEGYTFSGWGGVPSTMPAKDITISGSFTVNTYTITYMVDGELYKIESYTYGSAITAEESPVKEGHTFSGWSEVPETMPAKDITVSGSFTVNSYTITYIVDGEVYKTESIAYGSKVEAIAAPVKEGYTFSGWSGVPSTMPAKDVTVSGSFTVNTYTVTYMVDGELYKTESYAYGSVITAESPAKEGYTFSGWSEVPETMPAHDITIEGYYIVNSYNVVFIVDGEVIYSENLPYGSEIVAPEVPEKEGYTFNGWNELLATVPAHDVTFEGIYTVNVYKVYYYVGEELVHTAEVAYGDVIPEYVYEPTEGDYTFLGWEGDAYETMPAHDVYYIANMVTTGVEQLRNNNEAQVIYDLTGRKVIDTENLKGGIYIVNGKKVLIK